MNYFDKFNAVEGKLAEMLAKENLVHTFKVDTYPITLTISQDASPEAQLALFDTSSDGVSSRDAKLVFSLPVGEIGVRVYGRLIISDDILSRIKGYAKKMASLWLQGFFAQSMTRKSSDIPK